MFEIVSANAILYEQKRSPLQSYIAYNIEYAMVPRDKAIEALKQLRAARKFDEDMTSFYPGLADESLRVPLTERVNRSIDVFITEAQAGGQELDYLNAIQTGLSYFKDGYGRDELDTEERERVCDYFELMMDAVGLESSEGILNRWLYGFDVGQITGDDVRE